MFSLRLGGDWFASLRASVRRRGFQPRCCCASTALIGMRALRKRESAHICALNAAGSRVYDSHLTAKIGPESDIGQHFSVFLQVFVYVSRGENEGSVIHGPPARCNLVKGSLL